MKTPAAEAAPVIVLRATSGWSALRLRELYQYRELLYFFTWRDIKVRYKQTLLGAAWAVLQPLLAMVVFTIFFGKMAKMPSDGVEYPIFCFVGLLPWTYFANSVSLSSNSLIASSNLVTKVYFPRLIMPMSSTFAGLVDYCISLTILAGMMAWYGIVPSLGILLVPPLLLVAFLAATGVGMWLSALNVGFRDVKYTIPFLVQLWLFLTPVIYPVSLLPERYRWLLALNPMTGVVEAHRAAILGSRPVDWTTLLISTSMAVLLFVTGALYFRRMERSFADVI